MEFIRTWLTGYYDPFELINKLKDKPAPQWGFYAASLRAVFDSLLIYLPLAILGREPSTPSSLTFLSIEDYYWASVFFMPVFLVALWILLSSILHLLLRLMGKNSSIDQILNITGMTTLVVGAFLIPWDWIWIIFRWNNPVLLGISHIIIVVWGIVIMIIGYRRILQIPLWLAIVLNIIWMFLAIPLAMIFVRPPV
jgi:hypothetical protein